jgi:hypothetical protein
VRCGVNDNETVSFRSLACVNAGQPGSLEDEMAAAVREADLALAEAGYLSKLQHSRKSALDFIGGPEATRGAPIRAQAAPSLL